MSLNLDKLKIRLAEFSEDFKDPLTDAPKFTWEELDRLYDFAGGGYEAAWAGEPRVVPKTITNKYAWLFWMYGWDVFHQEQEIENLAP